MQIRLVFDRLFEQNMTNENKTKQGDIIGAMFEAGAHFGYQKSRRDASVSPFVFGTKNKIDIIDLESTKEQLEKAKEFITKLAKEGKTVLFVGGKNEAKSFIKLGAESINQPFVASRWIGGTLTNASEIKKRIAKFEDLAKQKEKGELTKYTKKERLLIDRQIDKFEQMFSGIVSMKDLPKALFIIDPKKESIAVSESKKMNIPVVSLLNTDCNIKDVDYPIVGNDASTSSISFFVNEIVASYKEGKSSSK